MGEENQEFGVCPCVTFYICNKDCVEILNKVVAIYIEFENSIIDKPFQLRFRSDTEVWKKANKWIRSRNEMLTEMTTVYKNILFTILVQHLQNLLIKVHVGP